MTLFSPYDSFFSDIDEFISPCFINDKHKEIFNKVYQDSSLHHMIEDEKLIVALECLQNILEHVYKKEHESMRYHLYYENYEMFQRRKTFEYAIEILSMTVDYIQEWLDKFEHFEILYG